MDINLFEDFNHKKIDTEDLVLIFVFSLVIMSLLFGMIYNQIKIKQFNTEISKRVEIIEHPKSKEKITELEELNLALVNAKNELAQLTSLDNTISDLDVLAHDVLGDIDSKVLEGLILSHIDFNENMIELNGAGISPNRIAEYSKGLSEINYIDKVHIATITFNEGYYNFLISLTVKGVSNEIHD